MAERVYDPEIAAIIPHLPVESDFSDMPAARANMLKMVAALQAGQPLPRGVAHEERMIPGPQGAPEVRVRVYRPESQDGALPGVLYIHGGGFVMGSIDVEHPAAAALARDAEAVVVSVAYRLAPENPFPAGLEDCYSALEWMAENAAELRIDREHVAVSGQSAGGGLAAAVALLARDRKGPKLCLQVLGIPELDDRLETPSMKAFTDTPLWNRPSAIESWRCYLGSALGGDISYYAAPARAEDLSGLPPAYVSTMEFDPLRDEGILYALRLLQHGVSVELHQYPGTFHGVALAADSAISRRVNEEMTAVLQRGLRR